MMEMDHARTLMLDARLSDSARLLGLYLASRGDDWHAVPRDEVRRLLHGSPSREKVRRTWSELELYEYVERESGGRGHPDRFRSKGHTSVSLTPIETQERVPKPIETQAKGHTSVSLTPIETHQCVPKPIETQERVPKPTDAASEPRPHVREHAGAPVAVAVVRKIDSSTPPVVPPTERAPPELDPTAVRYLEQHAGALNGCGDALSDYLAARVPPDQQGGYVSTVMTWLSGFGFNWRGDDGRTVPREQWTRLLAAALAELWATDETARKYPCGDPANLRIKLNHVLRDISRSERYPKNHGGDTSDGRRYAAGTGAGEGRPAAGTPNDGRRIPID